MEFPATRYKNGEIRPAFCLALSPYSLGEFSSTGTCLIKQVLKKATAKSSMFDELNPSGGSDQERSDSDRERHESVVRGHEPGVFP